MRLTEETVTWQSGFPLFSINYSTQHFLENLITSENHESWQCMADQKVQIYMDSHSVKWL